MTPEDLSEVARWLADDSRTGRAKQAYRRRFVSTSYYALFHALALLCTDEFVGLSDGRKRDRVYRSLDHAAARNGLQALASETGGDVLKRLASIFSDLQKARHDADYSQARTFSAQEALSWRDVAAEAVFEIGQFPPALRMALAVRLMFKIRSDRR